MFIAECDPFCAMQARESGLKVEIIMLCSFKNEELSQLYLFSDLKEDTTCRNDLHLLSKEIE